MKKGFRGTGTVERVNFPNKGIAVTDDGDRVIAVSYTHLDVYKRQAETDEPVRQPLFRLVIQTGKSDSWL